MLLILIISEYNLGFSLGTTQCAAASAGCDANELANGEILTLLVR